MISVLAALAAGMITSCGNVGAQPCLPLEPLKAAPPEWAAGWCAGYNDAALASDRNALQISLRIYPHHGAKGPVAEVERTISGAVLAWAPVPSLAPGTVVNDYVHGISITCPAAK